MSFALESCPSARAAASAPASKAGAGASGGAAAADLARLQVKLASALRLCERLDEALALIEAVRSEMMLDGETAEEENVVEQRISCGT